LVIDDEQPLADAIVASLEHDDRTVEAVYDPWEAQRLLEDQGADIVISDLRFPGEGAPDGLQLLERAKAAHPETEFIMITGYGDTQTAFDAKRWGALRFFHKPLDLELLNDLVEYLEIKLRQGDVAALRLPDVPGTITDTEAARLQRAYLAGEEDALSILLTGYRRLAFSISTGWYGLSSEDAEDVYQSACVDFMIKISRIRNPRPFIIGTVMNLSKKSLMSRSRFASLSPDYPECPGSDPSADRVMAEQELEGALRRALDYLDPQQRQLVGLLFEEEVPYKELAERMNIPIGSIGPTRQKILKRLRALMGEN
jgi:RNA polymerase sigma factor (sigma-70 family)